ncbi:MAG: hypothetical protein ACFE0Q_20580 [Anaerolineae bacterium]
MTLLTRLFPSPADNTYRGHQLAVWVLVILTIITLGRSLIHMFAPDGGAQSIATIPLDTYTEAGANTVIRIFGLWGLSQLLIGVLYGIVLIRYRALIPLMYLLMVAEYASRILLGELKPISTVGTAPGGVADYILVPLALVMLALSLWHRQHLT